MISILILTKNEANDLPACLESVAWSDDVHVFDSLSTDKTVEVARKRGAQVTERAFDGYASQRNAALHGVEFKYPWVLILDADERIPKATAKEMKDFLANAPEQIVACRLRRRDFLFGRWLKHAQISPFYVRLVRPAKVEYEREINEVLRVDGEIHELSGAFDHYPFSKGIAHWIEKHNLYSTMESHEVLKVLGGAEKVSLPQLFQGDFNERRVHQKRFFYRLPGRPIIKWLYMVLGRRAFLDGMPGMTYATLQSIYEYMIVLKTRELEFYKPSTQQPPTA
jgi:glycosyltransferase involved in cell wall biosynthesis